MKICLGTAFQGMQYGISGDVMPNMEESVELLRYSFEKGVDCLDTAPQYGCAEEIVGQAIEKSRRDDIKVVTKIRHNVLDDLEPSKYVEALNSEVEASLNRLKSDRIYGLLFHSAKYIDDENALDAIKELKKTSKVEKVGISIYTVDEALKACESEHLDIVQIPYNVFDTRLDRTDFFKRCKENGKLVFARSIFLQGLLLMDPKKVPDNIPEVKPYLIKLREIAEDVPLSELCMAFCANHDFIDYTIVGARNKSDIDEDINAFRSEKIYEDKFEELRHEFKDIEEKIINPTMWNK